MKCQKLIELIAALSGMSLVVRCHTDQLARGMRVAKVGSGLDDCSERCNTSKGGCVTKNFDWRYWLHDNRFALPPTAASQGAAGAQGLVLPITPGVGAGPVDVQRQVPFSIVQQDGSVRHRRCRGRSRRPHDRIGRR